MFNALRKLVSSNDASTKIQPPPGVQAMGQSLQRRFAKGIHYNMKIIIKGDRNVGKSCLFLRLQGQKFKEEYIPTEEIQVTSIQWNYKATDDVVKVEVWDVVDKGKKRKRIEGLKLDNKAIEPVPEEPALDAEFIDVYKGTNGVIMLLDITKQWTFAYIQRELPLVPHHIPILVLANHRDMGHHRTVTEDQVRFFIDGLERPEGSAQIRYAESSMRNGFGLKYLHKFFNLPFLQLQRETLLKQLEINTAEITATVDELDCLSESEEQNYDVFLDSLTNRRRQVAEQLSQVQNSPSVESINAFAVPQVNGVLPETSIPQNNQYHHMQPMSSIQIANKSVSVPVNLCHAASPDSSTAAPVPVPTLVPPKDLPKSESGFMSRLFNKSSNTQNKQKSVVSNSLPNKNDNQEQVLSPTADSPVKSVEDFVPEDNDHSFNSFLDDSPKRNEPLDIDVPAAAESESDEDAGNPMVTDFQDELDPEDSVGKSAGASALYVESRPEENSDEHDIYDYASSKPNIKKYSKEKRSSGSSVEVNLQASEVAANSQSHDDTDKSSSLMQRSPVCYSLYNEDLSVLEQMYSNGRKTSSGTPSVPSRSSPSATPEGSEAVSEDSSSVKSKKHRHKDKNKEEGKSHRKSHKHKKHKEKEESEVKATGTKKKKKKSKGAGELDSSSDVDKLEEFLGSDEISGERKTSSQYEVF